MTKKVETAKEASAMVKQAIKEELAKEAPNDAPNAKPDDKKLKSFKLDEVLCLKLQNVNLQKKLLEEKASTEYERISVKEKDVTKDIESKYSIKLAEYEVNLESGECTELSAERISQLQAQQRQQAMR